MSRLYFLGMSLFTYASYYTLAKSYNVDVLYDPKELLQEHADVDVDALLDAGSSKLGQLTEQVDKVTAQLQENTEWLVSVELMKVPEILNEEMSKISKEAATRFY